MADLVDIEARIRQALETAVDALLGLIDEIAASLQGSPVAAGTEDPAAAPPPDEGTVPSAPEADGESAPATTAADDAGAEDSPPVEAALVAPEDPYAHLAQPAQPVDVTTTADETVPTDVAVTPPVEPDTAGL